VLNSNANIVANFTPYVTLTTSVTGAGTIQQSPAGTSFPVGTAITLTAVPNSGATFQNWTPTGVCSAGTASNVCVFDLNTATTVTANFTGATNYTLTTAVSGPGTITQSPSGTSFASGTAITLTAVPNTGATFTSWNGGACAGSTSATCTFNISANTTVTATFAGAPAVVVPNPSQSGSAGSAFTFALSASGFSTPPTYTASCTIPGGTCTVSGSTLTVTTTASTSRATEQAALAVWPNDDTRGSRGNGSSAALAALIAMLAAFAMWLAGSTMQRRPTRMRLAFAPLAVVAMLGGLVLLAACGGGGGGGQTGTPAGTYTVTVTATAGTQTAKTTVSVTVQ
jgi:hypothetical protein